MHVSIRPVFAAVLIAASLTAVAQGSPIYDSNGFETPTFTAGNLGGQDGWTVVVGAATDSVVQTSNVYAGNQAVQLKDTGSRVLVRYSQIIATDQWLDMMLYAPAAAEIQTNASIRLRGRNAANTYGSYLQLSLSSAGKVNEAPSGPNNQYQFEAWNRFTVKLDLANNTWDLYINGELAGENLAFIGGADVTRFEAYEVDWTSKVGASSFGVGIDNFQITTTNPIPEPASAAIVSVICAMAMMVRTR